MTLNRFWRTLKVKITNNLKSSVVYSFIDINVYTCIDHIYTTPQHIEKNKPKKQRDILELIDLKNV